MYKRYQSTPPTINKLNNSGDDNAGKQSETNQDGCPDSCGDCNTFFTEIIFSPAATNQAEDTVEATVLSQKAVDVIPALSLLDKNLSFPTACSFASALTQSSDDMKAKDELVGRRLTVDERKAALDNCRSLRLQISNFEANFAMEHGRIPTTSIDKAPLVDIYTQYREGKRCIRADAACRIQAAFRGAIMRMRASKKSAQAQAEAFIDSLLETDEMKEEDATLLTTQMIDKYLTTEERKKVATKVLSEKLYNHKDQLALATPASAKGNEYMCKVCEMPKLCSKNGLILRKCEVCPALNKKIVQKKKDEKKSTRLMDMEKKKLAYEKNKLHQLKQQMEDERKRMTAKDEQFAEKKAALLASASDSTSASTTSGSTYRNTSKSSILREPLEVRAKKRLEKMKAAKESAVEASENSQTEYGFGQESFSNIINNLRADLKNVVSVSDTTTRTAVEAKADDVKNGETDEDDNFIDDPEITHMQRKIRFSPSPHLSEGVSALEDCVSTHQHEENDQADDGKSYGGFANKMEYDKFQEAFDEFEREHEGIIEYMRQKVGRRDSGNRATRHARSSSAPSVSSDDDSREFNRRGKYRERDNCRGRRREHRHHDDYRHRRGTRHHERGHKYYDHEYDSDSMSSETSCPDYQRRRNHSSRSRRNFYDEYGKCDRGYDRYRRYTRPRDMDRRDYYRDDPINDYDYEPRRRGHERSNSRRERRRDDYEYKLRRRGQHRGHDYHGYTSHSTDSDQESLGIDRRARHSRHGGYKQDDRIPKSKTLTKPLGLN